VFVDDDEYGGWWFVVDVGGCLVVIIKSVYDYVFVLLVVMMVF